MNKMSCFAEKRETWVAKQNVVLWKFRGDNEESCITENYETGTKFYVRYWLLQTVVGYRIYSLEKVKKSKTSTTFTGSLRLNSVVEVTVVLQASSISIESILKILTNKNLGILEKLPRWNQR